MAQQRKFAAISTRGRSDVQKRKGRIGYPVFPDGKKMGIKKVAQGEEEEDASCYLSLSFMSFLTAQLYSPWLWAAAPVAYARGTRRRHHVSLLHEEKFKNIRI